MIRHNFKWSFSVTLIFRNESVLHAVPLWLWGVVQEPVGHESTHFPARNLPHCTDTRSHAHLGERLCEHTKQAVRCHSPTAGCTFIPNDITQVWVREGGLGCSFSLQPLKEQGIFEARRRVSKNIVADICVEATSLILKKCCRITFFASVK